MNYIKCSELIDFIAGYLGNELSTPERNEFDRHLNVCPACQVYLKTYQDTIRLSRAAEQAESGDARMAPRIPDELVRAIMAAQIADVPVALQRIWRAGGPPIIFISLNTEGCETQSEG